MFRYRRSLAPGAAHALRWSLIKSASSHTPPADETRSLSKVAKRDKGIWQRRFCEHEIRDADDLERHIAHIHYNSVKHDLVTRCRWAVFQFSTVGGTR